MANLNVYLSVVQIILSIVLTVLVLIQMRNAGLGGVFGGTDSGIQRSRRGIDKLLFNLTVATAAVFGIVSLLNVLLSTPVTGG